MRLTLKTAPASEPVTTATAKGFLKVDVSTDDTLIDMIIAAARQLIEEATGRRLINQSWYGDLNAFPGECDNQWWDGVRDGSIGLLRSSPILIPIGPVSAITSITYYRADGTSGTVDSSTYYLTSEGYGAAKIALTVGSTWPVDMLRYENGVRVEFVAGYGASSASVPSGLILATLNAVAHLYEHRGDGKAGTLPENVQAMLAPYRNLSLG